MNKYEFDRWYYYDKSKYIRYNLTRHYIDDYTRIIYVIVGLYGNDGYSNTFVYEDLETAYTVMDRFLDRSDLNEDS